VLENEDTGGCTRAACFLSFQSMQVEAYMACARLVKPTRIRIKAVPNAIETDS
jgi:hypothetical protein